jgi:signal transduction histidine kinase
VSDLQLRALPGPPRRWRRYLLFLVVPLALAALTSYALEEPLEQYLSGQGTYDETALHDWLDEARFDLVSLRDLVDDYVTASDQLAGLAKPETGATPSAVTHYSSVRNAVHTRREALQEHLQQLGLPTRQYENKLPLFPRIYRLEIHFIDKPDPPIIWDSQLPEHSRQARQLIHPIVKKEIASNNQITVKTQATVKVLYQLHANIKLLRANREADVKRWRLVIGGGTVALLTLTWLVFVQRRERERERQRAQAQQQADDAEKLLLQEENRREETERNLLEQRLATQVAEQKALELRSQLYAGIGIMAGSYAHNIKNLLVRPNDLLQRCLEADGLSPAQASMLQEVRETLGTVTDRLQQILRTVRRDPARSQQTILDINKLVHEMGQTWGDLAREKWKLDLVLKLDDEDSVAVAGDESHLQQAVENLLFNARDATFEMRNHLREAARQDHGGDPARRKQALIAAAGWRGRVVLVVRRVADSVVLEVTDNGAGMTEEVRRRCTETHFTTKRDNALYEGHNTGMGLGLSFVLTVLEHHHATLEVESEPLRGATFRARFPAAARKPQSVGQQ